MNKPKATGDLFLDLMADAEGKALDAIANWLDALARSHATPARGELYMAPFAVALGKTAQAAFEVAGGLPEFRSLYEDSLIAHLRWGLRGGVGPIEADGSPWVGPHAAA